LTGFQAYQMYLGIKLHFTSPKYDYFKFHGKTKAKLEAFEKRNDRYFFKKLANKFDEKTLMNFYVANFLKDDYWIGNLIRKDGEENYLEWQKKIDSIGYQFGQDVEYLLDLVEKFDDLFNCPNGQHPVILKQFLSKKISLETLTILNTRLSFSEYLDNKIKETVVWPQVKMKIEKYVPFLEVDYKKLNFLLKTKVTA
jgi:T4 gene Gp59 loader of gp41 DNA helicase/T4 gene Gp59 loader of gp41 DNA helicase C-term